MPPPAPPREKREKRWWEKISRTRYLFAALFLHLIVFLMVMTWIVFPAFKPPEDDFVKTYIPPASPPPPPPPAQTQVSADVPTHTVTPPTPVIATTAPTMPFNIPLPDIAPTTATDNTSVAKMMQRSTQTSNSLSSARLSSIMATENGWGRDANNIRNSNSDPHNVVAKFPVYLASYANGDWGCNVSMKDGKINGGSLPNLVAKINEWSHSNITGNVVPDPLSIGGPDLMEKKPPFIFFTGHKDFVLTDTEIENLRSYLQVGGAIWGDNTLAGRGSRFDVAFRREMKRVVPDDDKNFEPVPMTSDIFTKSWFNITKLPQGMVYYDEPIEQLNIDGKLAILYTPNDYSDMMCMRIFPGDTDYYKLNHHKPGELFTNLMFYDNAQVFFRNFNLPSCLAVQQLGMNIVGYLLVRFDKDLLLTP